MGRKIFELLHTSLSTVLMCVLVLNFLSCESNKEDNGSDIAVTGLVDTYGCMYANISGYANLNLLSVVGIGDPIIGVELIESDADDTEDARLSTTSLLNGNVFMVSFYDLTPATKYKYRSFVTYAGETHYGEYCTFNTMTERPIDDAVDLGLSVKWAICNVGAKSPEEYGGYYAWGEIEEKDIYEPETYLFYNDESYEHIGYDIGGTKYDVVSQKWGEKWRMPTGGELNELYSKCSWEWTSVNDIYGYKVSGNGNSIFLPASGFRSGENISGWGVGVSCWSSGGGFSKDNAFFLYYTDGYWDWNYCGRHIGCTIRPVTE